MITSLKFNNQAGTATNKPSIHRSKGSINGRKHHSLMGAQSKTQWNINITRRQLVMAA